MGISVQCMIELLSEVGGRLDYFFSCNPWITPEQQQEIRNAFSNTEKTLENVKRF